MNSLLTPKCSPATSLACHQDWHKGLQQLTRGQAASLLIFKVRERVSETKTGQLPTQPHPSTP